MRLTRAGQSTAEYAVLFALIVGAAIAVQQFVRVRLQGAVKGAADTYVSTIQGTGGTSTGITVTPWSPDRNVTGSSKSDENMTSATQGSVTSTSGGQTTQRVGP